MNQNGSNFVALVLDTSLLVAVNKKASENKQLNATYLLSVIVEHCKEELTEEAYSRLKKKYSISAEEQMTAKKLRQKEQFETKKKELELKEREIALKEQNALMYRKQTQLSIGKKKKEIEKQLRNLTSERRHYSEAPPKIYDYYGDDEIKKILAEIDEKIRDLECQLKNLGAD